MRLFCTAIAAFALASTAHSQETPRATVDAIFDAMRAGDGDAIRALVSEDAHFGRVIADGSFQLGAVDNWVETINTLGEGVLDEQIFSVTVHEFGDLANIWAPFTISRNGGLIGCGVNQFTLARTQKMWRVIHLADTQDTGDCATFKARYNAAY